MSEETSFLTIGEASERTGLPESTIRFYDREFADYLSIQRGDNNQRLFTEENLTDLEYIRFLIKRENLSVDEVGKRLEREEGFKDRSQSEDSAPDDGDELDGDRDPEADGAQLKQELEAIRKTIEQFDENIARIEEDQETILKLLDMNLQRYNELVKQLPTHEPE